MYPQARKDKLTVRDLPDETLIYDLERHKAHCLNATCGLVWKHCDGRTSLSGLVGIVREKLHIAEAEPVVQLALEQLSRRNLLEQAAEPLSAEARLSRREVLRRMTVAAVALPLIMTIASPTARAAGLSVGDCTGQADNTPCLQTAGSGFSCCRGKCVFNTDFTTNQDCGRCGNSCATFQTCVGGQCVDLTPG